jgi:hypothetical protein
MHDAAPIDEADTGAAVDRRRDAGVAELGPRVLDPRLVAADLRRQLGHHGALGIELLGSEAARRKIGETLQVELGIASWASSAASSGQVYIEARIKGENVVGEAGGQLVPHIAF